ncbi:TPA: hypothetical protein EYN23_16705, partial [Candidatus Poribacteria bacterium]|nr:hypothetical protein [Candidatus Poribacteria bacterium]
MDKSLPLQKAISTDIVWNQPSRPPGATDIPLHSFKSVICPVCGDDYIHFGETKVFERDDKVVLGDYWYDVGWECSMPDLARKVKADSGDSGVGFKKIEQPR